MKETNICQLYIMFKILSSFTTFLGECLIFIPIFQMGKSAQKMNHIFPETYEQMAEQGFKHKFT